MLPFVVPVPAHWARRSGSESGTRFAGSGSPWPDPFPPSPPPPLFWFCSETSPVLWVCPTSRVRSSSAPVLELPDASRERWSLSGEPGISQLPCKMCPYVPGSQTAQDSRQARNGAWQDVAFRVVSGRRRPEVRGISRLNNLARSSSCLRFVSSLAAMPARLGAGVACYAFAVRLFHSLHLNGFSVLTAS